jgi:hypothetical protein
MTEFWSALNRFVASAKAVRRLASSSVASVVLSTKYSVSLSPVHDILNRTRTHSILARLFLVSGVLDVKNCMSTGMMVMVG